MEKFHEKLKMLRKKEGFTQQQIADEIGVNRGSYSNWEKGKREPSFENLVKLADLLEVSLDWLFGRDK
ncbi:MAG: helix-turn-helix transcriptional regulator [Streptococcus oralis]|nr:helix-turn-helix transcriptional regulator [Streptococcus oralis]